MKRFIYTVSGYAEIEAKTEEEAFNTLMEEFGNTHANVELEELEEQEA